MPTDTSSERYRNDTQQQLITLAHALARTWPEPAAIAVLAQETGLSRDQILRTLSNLQIGGWAERGKGGWLLSPSLSQISERMRLSLAQLHLRYLE